MCSMGIMGLIIWSRIGPLGQGAVSSDASVVEGGGDPLCDGCVRIDVGRNSEAVGRRQEVRCRGCGDGNGGEDFGEADDLQEMTVRGGEGVWGGNCCVRGDVEGDGRPERAVSKESLLLDSLEELRNAE